MSPEDESVSEPQVCPVTIKYLYSSEQSDVKICGVGGMVLVLVLPHSHYHVHILAFY